MSKNQEEMWLLQEKYRGEKTTGFFTDLKRLASGEPLGYIIGHVPFLDCLIHLDSHPLVPRPETEFWVEKAIQLLSSEASGVNEKLSLPLKVLDLCAGSGCIGVAVAKAVPNAQVDFAEIDIKHHITIKKNLEENKINTNHSHLFSGNLFEQVKDKYDFILTNPPYIDPAVDRAEESVKKHEPHLALYGGESGLQTILTIIHDSKNYLSEGGQLWIEHEPEQVEAIKKSAEACGFSATTHPDEYGTLRYSVFTLDSSTKKQ